MPSGRRSSRRRRVEPHPELDVARALGGRRTEDAPDGEWVVQTISAAGATKAYVCPGCRSEVPVGTAHVVAWRTDALLGPEAGLEGRRHWHSSCWAARLRRR